MTKREILINDQKKWISEISETLKKEKAEEILKLLIHAEVDELDYLLEQNKQYWNFARDVGIKQLWMSEYNNKLYIHIKYWDVEKENKSVLIG